MDMKSDINNVWTYDSTTTMHIFIQRQQSTPTYFNTCLHQQFITNNM